jgi:hypothetical protein
VYSLQYFIEYLRFIFSLASIAAVFPEFKPGKRHRM